jgi:hypothetical protein
MWSGMVQGVLLNNGVSGLWGECAGHFSPQMWGCFWTSSTRSWTPRFTWRASIAYSRPHSVCLRRAHGDQLSEADEWRLRGRLTLQGHNPHPGPHCSGLVTSLQMRDIYITVRLNWPINIECRIGNQLLDGLETCPLYTGWLLAELFRMCVKFVGIWRWAIIRMERNEIILLKKRVMA